MAKIYLFLVLKKENFDENSDSICYIMFGVHRIAHLALAALDHGVMSLSPT